MKRIMFTVLALLLIALPLSSTSVQAASLAEDGSCLFFTETGEGKGGFSVCDDGEAKFRTAFEGWGLENIG
jgi:hypothetical protein